MNFPRVSVNGVSVRVDNEGRYNLNDFHAAAMMDGKATESQRPGAFLKSRQISRFVQALSDATKSASVKVIKGGINQGTWAMELVVIRYAAWLKPEFEILVYNTFKDAARKGLDVMAKLNKLDHIINTETKNVSGCARTMANWGVGGRKQLLLTARERVVKEAQTAAQLARFRRNVGVGYGSFWRGVIFDTEYKNLADIITQSKRMYRLFKDGARFLASASELKWVWPTGEELLFRFGKEADDYWDYHGQEFPFIGFNELTKQKSADFYEAMFSCCRSSFRPKDYPLENGTLLKPIPLEVFSTTNPFGIGHTWVKKRFIEPAPRGTVIRETQKVFNPQTERDEEITLIRVAIHGSFKENPYLDPIYIATLMAIKDPNRKKAWVEGSWDVTSGGRFDHLWNATQHVIKPFRIPDSWTVDRSHDWGESKPFSNLWWAQSDGTEATLPDGYKFCPPSGSLILIGEWYGCPPDELNKGLKSTAN